MRGGDSRTPSPRFSEEPSWMSRYPLLLLPASSLLVLLAIPNRGQSVAESDLSRSSTSSSNNKIGIVPVLASFLPVESSPNSSESDKDPGEQLVGRDKDRRIPDSASRGRWGSIRTKYVRTHRSTREGSHDQLPTAEARASTGRIPMSTSIFTFSNQECFDGGYLRWVRCETTNGCSIHNFHLFYLPS